MTSLSVSQHRALVDALVEPLSPLECTVAALPYGTGREGGASSGGVMATVNSTGLVLARDVTARLSVPPFTNSAMDGFAVRQADIVNAPVSLPVSGDVAAGDTRKHTLEPGTAMRIMTGAPLPQGADTVVKVEETDHSAGASAAPSAVAILASPDEGTNVRAEGEDVNVGDPILPAGLSLTPAAVSAAVSVGYASLPVYPRPRIGILTTGRELVAPGSDLAEGQIPDSNGPLIAGLVTQAGGDVVVQLRSTDNPRALLAALDRAPDIDLLITAGGISAGAYEVVRQALSFPTMRFHHVKQQPGGPQGIGTGRIGGKAVPVACLPGNPVSVYVSFHVYVAGMIRVLSGRTRSTEPVIREVVADAEWASPRGKVQFIPLRSEGGLVRPVHELGSRSHLVASLSLANGLGVVEAAVERVKPADRLGFIATEGGGCG